MKPNSLIQPGRLREIALKVEDDLEQPAVKVEIMEDDKIPDLPMALQNAKREIKNSTMEIPTSTENDTTFEEPGIKREAMDKANKSDVPQNETLEQMAVRELMEDAKKQIKVENPVLQAIPASSKGVAGGENEVTFCFIYSENYVPIASCIIIFCLKYLFIIIIHSLIMWVLLELIKEANCTVQQYCS